MRWLTETYRNHIGPRAMILIFFAVYILGAVLFQHVSKIPPWEDGSPVDILTGSMIWVVSVISLLMAAINLDRAGLSMIWLAGSAALGLVALDELFGLHEHAAKIRDDDDPKILMAIGAGIALFVLVRVQRVRGLPLSLLIAGFFLQCLYLLSDLGDGDFFDVRFGHPDVLRVVEECLEFSAMACYLAAFMLILLGSVRLAPAAPRGRLPET